MKKLASFNTNELIFPCTSSPASSNIPLTTPSPGPNNNNKLAYIK